MKISGNYNISDVLKTIEVSSHEYPQTTLSMKGKAYTCINPYSYKFVRKNLSLFGKFDGLFVDGIFMCLVLRFICGLKIPRLSFDMTSMAKDLFGRLSDTGETIYFIGAREEEINNTVKIINMEYPKMNILGYHNGFFHNSGERSEVINDIITLNPDFTIVGLGTPLQEQFIMDLKDVGYNGISFSCGGFLRQTANGIDYYPKWIDKYNLRGFYRQFKEKGIFRRNYDTFILFPILFTKDIIKSKFK